MIRSVVFLSVCGYALAQSWQPQESGVTASLRGISAPGERVAWASGSGGPYLVTTDGGTSWRAAKVPGAEALDFRAVHALDDKTAWLMSIGPGARSRRAAAARRSSRTSSRPRTCRTWRAR